MGLENPLHLLFVAAVALVVLGPRRLPELARALGHGIREFREAIGGEGEAAGGEREAAGREPVDPAQALPSRDAPDRRPL